MPSVRGIETPLTDVIFLRYIAVTEVCPRLEGLKQKEQLNFQFLRV